MKCLKTGHKDLCIFEDNVWPKCAGLTRTNLEASLAAAFEEVDVNRHGMSEPRLGHVTSDHILQVGEEKTEPQLKCLSELLDAFRMELLNRSDDGVCFLLLIVFCFC